MISVSVITVAFNTVATIGETLDSVRRQMWRPLESVVVDGASTDGTQDIVADYADITGTVVSEQDKGIYDAMNKGIALARGEVLHFLNADDSFASPLVVNEAVRAFQSHADIDLVFGDAVYCSPEGRYLRRYRHVNAWNLVYGDLCHQVVFSHRRLFDRFGTFNVDFRINADYDWLLRVFRGGAKAFYLPIAVANFRVGGACSEDVSKTLAERRRVRLNYVSAGAYFVGDLAHRATRKIRHLAGDRDFVPFDPKVS